ncbi:hypothetical protein FPQ18DRAFT_295179 [Pyronema domesticum]|nr:hypothetical protein FPQ18DRAFT_295179 [Pyronema domesticum]
MTDPNQPKHITDYSLLPKYIFVSIPNDEGTLSQLKGALPGERVVTEFPMPPFESNIGDTSELAARATSLGELDKKVTADVTKIAELLKAIVPDNEAKYKMIEYESGKKVEAIEYLQKFEWDANKYAYERPSAPPGAAPSIKDLENALESDTKGRIEKVGEAHANYLEASKRNDIRTLPIAHLFRKEDFVQTLKLEIEHEPPSEDQSSKARKPNKIEFFPEYIVTLLAIVPHKKTEDWCQNYSKLKGMEAGMVVPDSSFELSESETYKFYSVTLVKKYKDTFIQAAKAEDYIIRDVDWSSADSKSEAQAIIDAEVQTFEEFLNLASTAYSELFMDLLHIKMLRIYVESILRYGPGRTFLSVVVGTHNNDDANTVTDILYDKYAHLAGKAVHYDEKGRIIKQATEGGIEEEHWVPFSCYEITIV